MTTVLTFSEALRPRARRRRHRLAGRREALALAILPVRAEVADLLAALRLEVAIRAYARGVDPGTTVDRAPAVVGPDVVDARATLDDRRAVAGIEPVVARSAVEDVALRAVVADRIPVAPEDVVAAPARQLVRAVVAEQLVVERPAGLRAWRPAVLDDLPEDAAQCRPGPRRGRLRECGPAVALFRFAQNTGVSV